VVAAKKITVLAGLAPATQPPPRRAGAYCAHTQNGMKGSNDNLSHNHNRSRGLACYLPGNPIKPNF